MPPSSFPDDVPVKAASFAQDMSKLFAALEMASRIGSSKLTSSERSYPLDRICPITWESASVSVSFPAADPSVLSVEAPGCDSESGCDAMAAGRTNDRAITAASAYAQNNLRLCFIYLPP